MVQSITVPHPPDAKNKFRPIRTQNFGEPMKTYLNILQVAIVPPISPVVFLSVVELPFLSFVKTNKILKSENFKNAF